MIKSKSFFARIKSKSVSKAYSCKSRKCSPHEIMCSLVFKFLVFSSLERNEIIKNKMNILLIHEHFINLWPFYNLINKKNSNQWTFLWTTLNIFMNTRKHFSELVNILNLVYILETVWTFVFNSSWPFHEIKEHDLKKSPEISIYQPIFSLIADISADFQWKIDENQPISP
jgi:hypothetical protein